ncbi:Molybdenum ABC transporter permease protein ModB [hydrothermal vent metagenome]|uniref:Molybdenum ABC transporter permease protein ModB n=1 Tax=hydrothermal vent metagenome TaxID=652676 RepID=A0A3B0Y0V1_9ZZZZ
MFSADDLTALSVTLKLALISTAILLLAGTPLDRFFSVAVPLARHGYLSALVLGFAHTVGEFGVVLMIGGSIAACYRRP